MPGLSTPIERTRVAVVEGLAQARRQVPLAAADVRTAIDHSCRDDAAVRRILERDLRPARQRAMSDTDDVLGVGEPAGGPLAVEPRSVPADVRVVVPDGDDDDPDLGGRLVGGRVWATR